MLFPAAYTAAKIIQEKIFAVLGRVMPLKQFDGSNIRIIKKNYSIADILNAKLVFSIGRNKIYKKVQPHLPLSVLQDNPQGYVIKPAQIGNTDVIFLFGETALANYYAAATAIQLFEADKAVYYNATIVDYPDFTGRSYVFKNWKNSDELHNELNDQRAREYSGTHTYYLPGKNRSAETSA